MYSLNVGVCGLGAAKLIVGRASSALTAIAISVFMAALSLVCICSIIAQKRRVIVDKYSFISMSYFLGI